MVTDPFSPMTLTRGPAMKNRFMLAPLTNMQSHADGTLSDEEIHWLERRAEGGFGLTMTAAAHVLPAGQAFKGQLGVWSDDHLPGLKRLADTIRAKGSLSSVQLHHGGWRAMPEFTGQQSMGPFAHADTNSRAMTTAEVEEAVEAFIAAAVRCEQVGFDGVELHGAHSYLICQFLDTGNQRDDGWGGSFANRRKFLDTIIAGIRERTGPQFQLGVRVSPERHGMATVEARELVESLMLSGQVDYVDMSLWSCFKTPVEEEFAARPLIEWFTDLKRGNCRLGVAGKIMNAATVRDCLASGADFVLLGRAAIIHHDFPKAMAADPDFASLPNPVSRAHLLGEGLSPGFVDYMASWAGFVAEEEVTA
jgi:2,4-dienoyl-CoA reductase-like NADH-dependent reductase (Old Yellow Enzyme family)